MCLFWFLWDFLFLTWFLLILSIYNDSMYISIEWRIWNWIYFVKKADKYSRFLLFGIFGLLHTCSKDNYSPDSSLHDCTTAMITVMQRCSQHAHGVIPHAFSVRSGHRRPADLLVRCPDGEPARLQWEVKIFPIIIRLTYFYYIWH